MRRWRRRLLSVEAWLFFRVAVFLGMLTVGFVIGMALHGW